MAVKNEVRTLNVLLMTLDQEEKTRRIGQNFFIHTYLHTRSHTRAYIQLQTYTCSIFQHTNIQMAMHKEYIHINLYIHPLKTTKV